MKRLTIFLGIFFLIFSALSLFVSSPAIAYDPKNDLASAIDLKATGIMVKKTPEMGSAGSSSGAASIPVGDGVSTYVDCSTPSRQDPARETAQAFRTVLGFHIILK